MSIINNHQMISYLHQHDISQAMIKILEEQRISDDDIQTIDRDDIDHLFKNESGFTFRDRKHFWNTILKFRSMSTQNDVIYIDQSDEPSNMYNMMNDEPLNYQLTPHYVPIVSSNIPTTVRIYNSSDGIIHENMLELSSSEEDHDDNNNNQTATTSLPVRTSRTKKSSDIQYQYSFELPTLSQKVMRALETNNIKSEWATFINELARWVLSIKPTPILKGEFQAIGQTIYKHYPCIARDGFRPWSYLCRCLTQKIRRLGKKHAKKQITI